MAAWLKQGEVAEIKLGPFVSSTDGFTPQTGLTITQAEVRLAKNSGDWAQKSETTTMVHEENGWYRCLLNTTDTNTLGILIVAVNESGALPVWREFMVMEEATASAAVWDRDASFHVTIGTFGGVLDTLYNNPLSLTAAQTGAAVWDLTTTGHVTSGTFGEQAKTDVDAIKAKTDQITFGTANRVNAQTYGMEADVITSTALATSAVTEINTGIATSAALATAQTDIDDIQARLPAALVSGRMDSSVGAMAANVITAAATATDFSTEVNTGIATAASITTLSAFVDTEVAAILAAVDTEVAAIKAKTDSLTFTVAGIVDSNIERVNAVAVTGTGAPGDEWGP